LVQRGIAYVLEYRRNQNKSARGEWDFNNYLYNRLAHERRRGLDVVFWQFLVDELARWKAFRPYTKEYTNEMGLERLERLRTHYALLSARCAQLDFRLNEVSWVDVFPLFEVAAEIKPVISPSPVFASKLCHFLCPPIFPVFDNTMVKSGKIGYREYWTECKKRWEEAPEKDALIQVLRREIPERPCDHYPWSTKIVELCQYDPV
jgi:hypothetical protein